MAEENKRVSGTTMEKSGQVPVSFQIAEAYKMIRTNLLFTLANTDNRVVVFSSAEPGAGKSTLCCNLGIVMAQTGARVVLVDADMRKPVQHRNFRVSKAKGLSGILGGLQTLEECIRPNVMANLDLIPSGAIPPNPSELLGSDRMMKLLDELKERYDYVFIDTPPLTVVADALVLSPHTAGVVLVARQQQTMYDELGESADAVKQVGANVLGVVVVDVKNTVSPYVRSNKNRYYHSVNYEYSHRYDAKNRN